MENIERIQANLRTNAYKSCPHQVAEDRAILSGEYAWICSQMETILKRKPAIWNTIRKDVKSDTACEKAWEMTSDGLDETGLRLRAKATEKMMQGLSGLLKLLEGEKNNQW